MRILIRLIMTKNLCQGQNVCINADINYVVGNIYGVKHFPEGMFIFKYLLI